MRAFNHTSDTMLQAETKQDVRKTKQLFSTWLSQKDVTHFDLLLFSFDLVIFDAF